MISYMSYKKKSHLIVNIINIILMIIAVFVISKVWHEYEINDFGDFQRAEYNSGVSTFTRDDIEKYSNKYSYRIESDSFNDALIYRNIEVEQNQVYRVTAMVKFKDVENEKIESEGGVNIGIMDSTEKSHSLVGSGDWQKISFEFDSKNRTEVDIAFRLGSYDDNSKGTVWFSDFTLEKGEKDTENNWNFICFIMKNIEAEFTDNGQVKTAKESLTFSEIGYIESNMQRFQKSMKELSGGRMTVSYKTVIIEEPIKSVTNNEEYGYYVRATNIKDILEEYVDNSSEEYDHIFIAYKLGEDLHEEHIRTGDWIGLRWNGV